MKTKKESTAQPVTTATVAPKSPKKKLSVLEKAMRLNISQEERDEIILFAHKLNTYKF